MAGGPLKAGWRVSRIDREDLVGVELSVLWHTQGKGDEDLGVHHFRRYEASELAQLDPLESQQIGCSLPASPLSYPGHLLQIVWCIRVRVFLQDGREVVSELPFHLVSHPAEPAESIQVDPPEVSVPSPATTGRRQRWLGRLRAATKPN